jgi:mediator of RNA polymerase II transcription subunit 5
MLEPRQYGELAAEEITAFGAWFKALFDSNSEGIEDAIIRSALRIAHQLFPHLLKSSSTKPRVLCRISAVLFSQAISFCSVQKIDMDVLNNGVSYFLGPLLNWTLVGVVKVLLREIQQKG